MARYQPTLLVAWYAVLLSGPACAIDCYQCQSTDHTDPFQCDEFLSSDISIEPRPCSAVYDARYCVKHTGRFEGLTPPTPSVAGAGAPPRHPLPYTAEGTSGFYNVHQY